MMKKAGGRKSRWTVPLNKVNNLSGGAVGRADLGPGPAEHLLHRVHPVQPRQEVQPHRDAHHGEAAQRHLPLPG